MADTRTRADSALAGRSAVVTGGSRGLGLLMARRLVDLGCDVTVAARDAAELDAAAAHLDAGAPRHARVRTQVCDVTDRDAVRALMREAAGAHGGIDVVLANAGIIQVAPIDAIGADEFRSALDTMFMGAVHTALESLPYLRRSPGGGRLALIGSVGGLVTPPHLVPYACAKSAVAALAEGLRAEERQVSVTAVHPGLMRTGSHLAAEFGGDRAAEFGWFSALAGTPLLSMDAERAAHRIVRAVEARRTRLVLTPAAKAAGLAHGVAPALTVRLTALAARALPSGGTDGASGPGLAEGRDVDAAPADPVLRRLRAWGSALNDRAADAFNERRPRHQ
ncbi:SDR family NAD(P)-dependent oxidoreductase [Actinacidiphila sp. bgisy145]|uniref:SDR family NAD(P)-dependent oxidoreductase n=1 Tax=Actinacidiphila sp. bgisy145 TaxID=3413792 RepID=UPI003EBB2700